MVTGITPLRAAPTTPAAPPVEPSDEALVDARVTGSDRLARNMVLGSLVAMVVIRLFTEVVAVLPRFFNFVDVPIVAGLAVYSAIAPPTPRSRSLMRPAYGGYLIALIALWGLSLVTNVNRVSPMPALLFLYLVVSPVVVYMVVYRIWPVGQGLSLSKTFVRLAIAQFVVVVVIDLPRFIAGDQNPDLISGTFGENAYQLVFFLLTFGALLAGIVTFEPRRIAARLALPLAGGTLLVIFLAQYRALLASTFIAIFVLGMLLARSRGRGMFVAAGTALAVFFIFTMVLSRFPLLRFDRAINAIREEPGALVSGKLTAAQRVGDMFRDEPRMVLTGSGPATYSSRAWRTFGLTGIVGGHADVAGAYVEALTGESYRTDVNLKYVMPQLTGSSIFGSEGLASPFGSYVAILAELGLGGLVLLFAIYFGPFLRSARMAVFSMERARPGDPLPALLLASVISFLTLLQMGVLDNWLETTRVTFTSWILFAVAHKEFRARLRPSPQTAHRD